MRKLFLIIVLLIIFINTTFAAVLFEDNFDDHEEWSPPQKTGSESNVTSFTNDNYPIPEGYNGYTLDGSRYSDAGNNTLNITGLDPDKCYNRKGKAFVFWAEVNTSCGAWCGDGLLDIQLPGGETGYDEIYIRFDIKFDTNWQWATYGGSISEKMLHVAHHKSTDAHYDFFSTSMNKPRYFWNIGYSYNAANPPTNRSGIMGSALISAYLNGTQNPTYTNPDHGYYPGGDWGGGTNFYTDAEAYRSALISKFGNTDPYKNHDKGLFGDGKWHTLEWRLKMNSADGVADGIAEFWTDGIKIFSYTNIPWVTGDDPANRRWNYVWLGGNNMNYFAAQSEELEQWYAVDNFMIATALNDFDEVSATISGTGLAATEAQVAAGVRYTYTLVGTTWDADLGSDSAESTAFCASITGSLNTATSWNNTGACAYGDLTRASDTVLHYDPVKPLYDIAQAETITFGVVPASATALGETITPSPGTTIISYDAPVAVDKVGARVGQGSIGMSVGQGNIGVTVGN